MFNSLQTSYALPPFSFSPDSFSPSPIYLSLKIHSPLLLFLFLSRSPLPFSFLTFFQDPPSPSHLLLYLFLSRSTLPFSFVISLKILSPLLLFNFLSRSSLPLSLISIYPDPLSPSPISLSLKIHSPPLPNLYLSSKIHSPLLLFLFLSRSSLPLSLISFSQDPLSPSPF